MVAAQARSGEEWAQKARHVESMGYATLLMPDGLQHSLAPLPALTAAAMATRTLRVGTYVIANDYRNPVMLAKEAATVDVLSGGRFELGMGAGRPAAADDNRMLGAAFDSGAVRVARLAESLALIKALLSGQTVTVTGPHYAAANAQISPRPVQQPRPPILVAAGRSNDEIATELFISPATAKTHVSRAMSKLGARDRAQLVVLAYESGLVLPRVHST